jgi:hypothetical protein
MMMMMMMIILLSAHPFNKCSRCLLRASPCTDAATFVHVCCCFCCCF